MARVWRLGAVLSLLLLLLLPVPAFGLGGLLGPLVEPLEPVADGELLEPVTQPVVELVAPVTEPVVEILSPVTEPLDPITDPLLGNDATEPITDPIIGPIIGPVTDPDPQPTTTTAPPNRTESAPPPSGGRSTDGLPATSPSDDRVEVLESSTGQETIARAPAALLLTPSLASQLPNLAVAESAGSSLLGQILDWVGGFDAASFLAAPLLALEVLLRALASAGRGLLAPALVLGGLAVLMARDRRKVGTKTP